MLFLADIKQVSIAGQCFSSCDAVGVLLFPGVEASIRCNPVLLFTLHRRQYATAYAMCAFPKKVYRGREKFFRSSVMRILFVGHIANRTGAPLHMLSIMRWLQRQPNIQMTALLMQGGALLNEYRATCPVTVLYGRRLHDRSGRKQWPFFSYGMRILIRCHQYILWMIGQIRLWIFLWNQRGQIDCIFLNTVVTAKLIDQLQTLNVPMIMHVHEMSHVMHYSSRAADLERMRNHVGTIVCVSDSVAQNLIRCNGFSPENIKRIQSAVAPSLVDDLPISIQRSHVGIPENAMIVGMMGTMEWRKGVDVFVALARDVIQKGCASVHFVWIGKEERIAHQHLSAYFGITSEEQTRIHFLPEEKNGIVAMQLIDVLALTSREDPFPLVHIEAALLAKPIVCFDHSGGAAEWVADQGAGYVVPMGDISAFGDAIITLLQQKQKRVACGERARSYAQKHCTTEKVGPRLLETLHATIQDHQLPPSSHRV